MKKFEHIIVVGFSRVATNCVQILKNHFNQEILFYEFKIGDDKSIVDNFLNNIKNSFIVSANNFYIFKESQIASNIIINYHNSLLPRHKGTNPNIWAIYEGDTKSGITWHFVDSGIDTGATILQKEIPINKETTAASLLIAQNNLAIKSFEECLLVLDKFNFDQNQFIKNKDANSIAKKRNELPGGGILDISWQKDKIVNFLHAMDTGIFSQTPKPKLKIFDSIQEIIYYEVDEKYINLKLNNNVTITIEY